MNHYHNTTEKSGDKLARNIKKARTQNQKVLALAHGLKRPFSPSDIFNRWPDTKTPITSIRRAINKLKNSGSIVPTGKKVQGLYGRDEFQYKIA